jgi:hypothetical protein
MHDNSQPGDRVREGEVRVAGFDLSISQLASDAGVTVRAVGRR